MFGGMKGMGDIMKLMGQLPKMKENLVQAQERAKNRVVTGESGGGLVKVDSNGVGEILDVRIDPEALKDPETVGPLVAAATNLALRKSKEVMAEEAKSAMGGMDMPPGLI
ncbi:MAG TPA: YbaB/EbfC family nucleoid-associated protein [Planctomycetota bacterium]|nr:YbaB/EbfC family nucleoid-associated protein [Planctomycetota bacterium]